MRTWILILACCALLCAYVGFECGKAKSITPKIHSIGETQQELRDAGYYHGRIDNIWGPKTEKAYCDYMAAPYFTPSGGKE